MKKQKIILEALKAELKRVAFDANMHDKCNIVTPHTSKCSKRRKELLEAIEEVKKYK